MNKLQKKLDQLYGNSIATVDLEMGLPASESQVESAIRRIENTVRQKETEPNWSDDDTACFETAARLCEGENQGVRRHLRRRFSRSAGRLGSYIVQKKLHPSWSDIGERLRGICSILDAVFAMQAAIELIERCVTSDGVQNFPKRKDSRLIKEACDGVKEFRTELPKRIWQKFRESMWTLQAELRERYADPDWIALARIAHMPIPTIEWIRDVESAITVMADLVDSDPSVDPLAQRDPKVRHLCRVVRRFQRTGHCYLPALVAERLLDAFRNLAEAVMERPRPHLLTLKEQLRIDRTPYGQGYTCGGLTLFPRVDFKKVLADSTCDKTEPRLPFNPRLTLRLLRSLPDGTRLMSNRMNGFVEVLTAMNRQELWQKAKVLCIDQRTCWVNPPINLFDRSMKISRS